MHRTIFFPRWKSLWIKVYIFKAKKNNWIFIMYCFFIFPDLIILKKSINMNRVTFWTLIKVIFVNSIIIFQYNDSFAVPIEEFVTGTRDFRAGLCLKTVVKGSYSILPSVYAKQTKWAEQNRYECTGALFEMYVTYFG